ncbi:LOW QUALITY PROTEIN: sphingosine kinase 2 [Boleophthalmus pectinirostris]|uniref:LOW QUALITY PROTEIN: sphingosine kinase 2 n=1 Tax=Boleophthalmus pectinirostris TaxID=150288 RepID=UPI00242F3059|nr:LOW QUALITY PROTEIN: sphingosine kinase 2 [Boleophthalmus pectinirostris]
MRMRSPDPSSLSPSEALLHGQFASWGSGSNSNNNSCPNSPGGPGGISPAASPTPPSASNYALTLTYSHIHIQRLSPRPGKEARLLLPLSELVGCSCPRAPAPPLLVLYWYPPGKKRKGVSRRRQVRAYLSESRTEAERWSAAVQCLLRGVPVTADTEFSRSLLPRPRRLLLLVNPFSGRGQAMQWCQTHILPMIREANISYNLIQTERQNHARELIREISLPEWDGIIIVSGDGLLHEVINGLMERPDWDQAIKTPVGILPCGSGNALAGSVNHHAGYDMCLREPLLLNCCFLLCRGGVQPMDLVSVTTSPSPNSHSSAPRRLFSFLSVAWGFVSDVDIESERYRGLGSARFTLGTLVRIASLRSYKGRLSYLPPSITTTSLDTTPPPPRRPLSRSITEGLEGFCKTPIHRTCSDMGISEQRSLRRGEGEREKEERQRERERRRQRARGGGTGVVRASSLAEDRERELEMEAEEELCSERSGTSSESNEREDCNMRKNERLVGIKDEREEEGTVEQDSSEMDDDDRSKDGDEDESEGVLPAKEMGENYGIDSGKEADEETRTGYIEDSPQESRQAVRKNSAPSSQIVSALLSQPEPDTAPYTVEDMDLNGTYYQHDAYPLDPRERALTISSPFRHSPFSYKPKALDQNQNASRPRPLSLLQHSQSNSLPPKLSSLSLSLSPTPPSSPSCASPHASAYLAPRINTPNSTSPSPLRTPSSSFNFDIAEPAGPFKNRPLPSNLPKDDLLPPLDQPLPTRDWVTIEGDFVLVLALYQSHLGADLHAAPQARFDDGLIHLTFVRAGISRATLLRLFFAMERGTHHSVSSPYVSHVTCRAFRLQPLSSRGTLTVDGELVPYGPLQAQVHPSLSRLIVGDSGVKITRF